MATSSTNKRKRPDIATTVFTNDSIFNEDEGCVNQPCIVYDDYYEQIAFSKRRNRKMSTISDDEETRSVEQENPTPVTSATKIKVATKRRGRPKKISTAQGHVDDIAKEDSKAKSPVENHSDVSKQLKENLKKHAVELMQAKHKFDKILSECKTELIDDLDVQATESAIVNFLQPNLEAQKANEEIQVEKADKVADSEFDNENEEPQEEEKPIDAMNEDEFPTAKKFYSGF